MVEVRLDSESADHGRKMQGVGTRADGELARWLLLAGIEDAQGTIHANDAKCSAALITHGLLFAGVVTVTADAAKMYPHTHGALPVIALGLGGLAAAAFLISIMALLFSVMPYRSKTLLGVIAEKRDQPQLFFPPRISGHCLSAAGAEELIRGQLNALDVLDDGGVKRELVYESVKLAAVRDHEAGFARVGYAFLVVEVALVIAYLGVVAATALSTAS
jgi:hypothetical protein